MRKRFLSILLTMVMILGLGIPQQSFAEPEVTVEFEVTQATQYQEKTTAKATITSSTFSGNVRVAFIKGNLVGNVSTSDSETFSLKSGDKETITWTLDLYGTPLGKSIDVGVEVIDTSNNKSLAKSKPKTLTISPIDPEDIGKPNLPTITEKDYTYKPDPTVNYNPQMKLEVVAPSGGLNGGTTNSVQLKMKNTGNAPFNKVLAGISLGDKMTLKNASTEQDLGSMSRTGEASANFPVFVEASHPGGNIPLSFTVKATDPTGKEATFTITEYVTVNAGSSLADRLEIVNIQNPASVSTDQDFSLKFAVRNNSGSVAKNVKITVEPTAPVVNKTKNIFVVDLAGGESKDFEVKMFAVGGGEIQSQNYPIKITAETSGTDASSISQYSGVFLNAGNAGKTVPQIIITNYTYGDTAVVANEVFPLSIVLKNTNTSQTLRNIKVSFTAEEGIFIPHNTSNSFYIDKIAPGASLTKTVEFMTKPDAPEKTVSLNVDMSYEDSKGNPVSVKDIISVPVVQERRLVIDDIVPTDVYFVGEQGNLTVQYYNMGKNTLNNLVIYAEGDFDFPQSTKVFAGKFDAGKNDFYDLQFIPTKVGESSGKLIFTFEDSNGKPITVEKPFTIMAEEAIPEEPMPDDQMMKPEGMGKGKYIAIGAGVLVVAAGIVIYRKRKKKQIDSLDIGNE